MVQLGILMIFPPTISDILFSVALSINTLSIIACDTGLLSHLFTGVYPSLHRSLAVISTSMY